MEHYWTLISTDEMGYMLLTDTRGIPLVHMKADAFNPFDVFEGITSVAVMMELITKFEPAGIKQNKRLTEMLPDYYSSLKVFKLSVTLQDESGTPHMIMVNATKMKPGIKKYITARILIPDDIEKEYDEIKIPPIMRETELINETQPLYK